MPDLDPILDAWEGLLECGLLEWPLSLCYGRTERLASVLEGHTSARPELFESVRLQELACDELDDGAVFALCWYAGLEGPPPVLWFGSEGQVFIVAPDEATFLRQLASAQLWRGDRWQPFEPDPEQGFADWDAVHEIISDALGWNALEPDRVTALAPESHPALAAWIARLHDGRSLDRLGAKSA